MNDEELATALLDGDSLAFDEIYRRYFSFMLGIAISMLKDVHMAKDLVQDIFVKFYGRVCDKKVVASGGASGFRPMLSKMIKNACIDVFRSNQRMNFISIDNDEHLEMVLSSHGKDQFDLNKMEINQIREEYQRIALAISKLSKKQQLVIKLRYETRLSFLEISELEGESINTWLGRMRYALINLRKLLKVNKKTK